MTQTLQATWHKNQLWLWPADAGTAQPTAESATVLAPADAAAWLASAGDDATDSVRFWRELAALVDELLAAGRFYPDLHRVEEHYEALWRPWLSADQMIWITAMAAAMPPVCAAAQSPAETQSPEALAAFLQTFLTEVLDRRIRQLLAGDEFFTRVGERGASPPVAWLAALVGESCHIDLVPDEAEALADAAAGWLCVLDEMHARRGLSLCLTLHEPEDDADPWRLELGLHDPHGGQTYSAQELFDPPAGPAALAMPQRRQQFAEQLAKAAEIWPALSERAAHPSGEPLQLSVADAHAFLYRWSPPLRDKGVVIFQPDWAGQNNRIGLELMAEPAEGGRNGEDGIEGVGLFSLLDFQWRIAVGDQHLSAAEFRAMVERGAPLVRHGGRWLEIDTDASRRALEFIEKNGDGKMTLASAIRAAYLLDESRTGLQSLGLRGSGWLEKFLEGNGDQSIEPIAQPADFQGTLRPYQLRGLQWLWFLQRLGIGACLADDMGLGKTIQLIALLLHERHAGLNDGPTLIFAPTSVVGNWMRELERFAPNLRTLVHHGPERHEGESFAQAATAHDVVLTSYALACRDAEELSTIPWRRIVLDEAQKIKSPSAASSLAIRSLPTRLRVAMTGTPIENHLSELWSIMEFLNPDLLGSLGEFRQRFAMPIERGRDSGRAGVLRRLIAPFVLRRSKSDPRIAGDLPEKMEMRVYCNLTAEQAAAYQRIADGMLTQIESASGIRRRGLILAVLTRLKQVCDHPALLDGHAPAPIDNRSGKCERLAEMLEEVIEEGDSALVFTQFRQMGHVLEKLLQERLKTDVLFLHGGTPARMREQMVRQFQNGENGHRIFILSLRAGGLGLNLTAANHVFHFDRWWNPAVENQATDRAHRIGQTRKVQVHKFVCIGTLEERIDRMLADKLILADRIVGSGDEWLTNLSTEELRRTLALSADAVGEFG